MTTPSIRLTIKPAPVIRGTVRGVGLPGPAGADGTIAPIVNGSLVGNVSGATAIPSAITPSQAKTLLAVSWADILSKPSTFAPSAHVHPISDIAGLGTGVDAALAIATSGTGSLARVAGPTFSSMIVTGEVDVRNAGNFLRFGGNGYLKTDTSQLFLFNAGMGTNDLSFNYNGSSLALKSDYMITVASTTNAGATMDTSIGRHSPNTWQMGNGGANALGSLRLTDLTASGTVTVGSSAGGGLLLTNATGTQGRINYQNAYGLIYDSLETNRGHDFRANGTTVLSIGGTGGITLGGTSNSLSTSGGGFVVNGTASTLTLASGWKATTPRVDNTGLLELIGNTGNGIADANTVIRIGSPKYSRYFTITNEGNIVAPEPGAFTSNVRLDLTGNRGNSIADGVASIRLGTPKYGRYIDIGNEGFMYFPNGGGVNFANGAALSVSSLATGSAFVVGNNWMLANGGSGILRQVSATTAQTYELYGTYTDASNYRKLKFSSTTAGAFTITAEGLGTGATGNTLNIGAGTGVSFADGRSSVSADGSTITCADKFQVSNSGLKVKITGVPSAVQLVSSGMFGWVASATDIGGSASQTAFAQNAAGVVEINNGTAGTYRDLLLRNLTASGTITSTFQSLSANPTTVDLAAGQSRLVKNTTSGEIRHWVNDAGVVKSMAAFT